MSGEEDERDQQDRAAEDRFPVAAVDVRLDEEGDEQRGPSDGRVDHLPVEVVARIARHGEARRARHCPQADGDEAGHAGEEQPVERAENGDEGEPLVAIRPPSSVRSGVLQHQCSLPCFSISRCERGPRA